MSKEVNFLIYCMERYRYLKGLSGAEVAERFSKYDIYRYIMKYFETLHIMYCTQKETSTLCAILMIIY